MENFCGINKTLVAPDGTFIHDECLIDLINIIPHALLIIVTAPLVCLMNKKSRSGYDVGDWHEQTWPHFIAHNYRYIFTLFLIFFNLLEICEGIVAQSLQSGLQMHLYLPHCISLIASCVTLVYYHNAEVTDNWKYLLTLLIYWVLALSLKSWKVAILFAKGLNIPHLRFDLTWDCIVVYFGLLVVEIIVILKQLIKPAEVFQDVTRTRYIHAFVNFLSKCTFWWLNSILLLGSRRPLEISDLGAIPETERTLDHAYKLHTEFEQEKAKCKSENKRPSLGKSIVKCFWPNIALAGFFKIIGDLLQFFGPFAVSGIVRFVENNGSTIDMDHVTVVDGNVYISLADFMTDGFVLCVLLTLSVILLNTLMHAHHITMLVTAMRVRAAIQGMIYNKTLKLPLWVMTGGDGASQGKIVNHMSVDANQILFALFTIHFTWTVAIQFVIAVFMLYQLMGYSALVGAAWVFIIIPINYMVTKKIAEMQREKLKFSDERLKLTNELLQGIKLVKLFAWTELMCSSVGEVRKKEVRTMMKAALLQALSVFLNECGPVMILVTTYVLYPYIQDETLTTSKALSGLALISILKIPFEVFLFVFRFILGGYVSLQRLNKFFLFSEIADSSESLVNGIPLEREGVELQEVPPGPEDAIEIKMGSFKWSDGDEECYLKNINLTVPSGDFVMIVGEVGSGKSSLLHALLNEMSNVSGSVEWSKGAMVAYAAQTPWLLNATLQDNILFGQPLDKSRYKEVIAACALKPDIDILVAGDQTEIGEKGINLSGGQKQRVSVARALYSEANIVILDDPFSALDTHTGRHLFQEGLMKLLIKRKRTVLLVTHHLQYMAHANQVLVMNQGKISHKGTLEELNTNYPDLFTKSWVTSADDNSEEVVPAESKVDDVEEDTSMRTELLPQADADNVDSDREEDLLETGFENPAMKSIENIALSCASINVKEGKLIQEEERAKGAISFHIYATYIKACTAIFVITALLTSVLQHSFLTGKDFWLSVWSEASQQESVNGTNSDLVFYITGFTGLSLAAVVFTFLAALLTVVAGIKGAKAIHGNMLRHIVDAPLRFFDSTPIGRILNRFTSDTNIIDEKMPETTRNLIQTFLLLVSAMVVSAISSPFSLIGMLIISVFYVGLQRFFRNSSRELQRIENITKSPVFAHFSETLTGLSTIRAYRDKERFTKKVYDYIDINNVAYLILHGINRWLGVRLDYMGAFFTFTAAISGTAAGVYYGTPAGFVGLAIIYALSMAIRLNWLVRHATDFELHTSSVERILHYTDIEKEPQTTQPLAPNGVPDDWPTTGKIEFRDMSLQYAEDLPVVVHNMSAVIKGGIKVGICGRTGSGKSSITLGLFRMIQMSSGSIIIDDLDIGSVPLDMLRSRVSIIPQDPTLFVGTVRSNLDPAGEMKDDQLWHALEIAQLKEVVSALSEGLEAPISEGGANFSVGQRQLFCLARAFLRHSKILVMDEATASIDLDTDDLIQDVISRVFKHVTVLIVAHRVSTIMNCDLILVMDDGHLVEMDGPSVLMADETSIFSSLVSAPSSL